MSKRKTGLIFIVAGLPVFFYFFSIQKSEEIGKPVVTISKKAKRESPTNPYLTQLAHAYDSVFRTLMEKYDAPGASVAIVYDTTVILLQGYGVRELNTHDSVDIHTVYRLASVSKPFASFLTGILVQEKILKWDDTVTNYWPNFKLKSHESTREIKIRHVLSHTTGLPYHTYTNMIEEGLPADTLLNYLRDIKLVSKPGELYSYQNVGYSIIGKVIEQATGKNYQTQLQEKVFTPLGMKDASTDYIGLLSKRNMAQPHLFKRGMLRPTIVHDTYYNVSPAGGVNASIADMAKWLEALLGNRPDVIQKEILDSLFTPNVEANSRNRNFYKWNRVQQAYYGLGWRVLRFPNDTLIYHGGYVAGYRSEVALLPAEKIAICVLSNAPGQLIDNSLPVFLEIFDQYREAIKNWKPKEDLNL
jgi:beta-lactamase class C